LDGLIDNQPHADSARQVINEIVARNFLFKQLRIASGGHNDAQALVMAEVVEIAPTSSR